METPITNIREIIQLLYDDRIDVSDLTMSQRKEILFQANNMIKEAISLTDQIMKVPTNSHHDFNRLLEGNSKYIDGQYLKKLINNFSKIEPEIKTDGKPKTKNKKLTSYKWQNNPNEELPELCSLMIEKYKLIATETTYEQFKAIFTGQPIDENLKPIKWHQDNASELLYFIDRLEKLNNIAHNPNRADYKKLKACFVKPNGKPFNEAFKSLKTNLEINLSQEKQKAIIELVENF